jgi:hypothetical protein
MSSQRNCMVEGSALCNSTVLLHQTLLAPCERSMAIAARTRSVASAILLAGININIDQASSLPHQQTLDH